MILGFVPSFTEADDNLGGRRVIDLYVPVSVLLAMIMAGLQAMPPVLTAYRERGILRRMSTTPVRPSALLTAQIALHGAAALGSAALVVVVGRIGYGVALPGQFGLTRWRCCSRSPPSSPWAARSAPWPVRRRRPPPSARSPTWR